MTNLKIEIESLLKELIKIPSYSGDEAKTAGLIQSFFKKKGFECNRKLNNLWVYEKNFDPNKPVVLLNSHHDTVKAAETWTMDPFNPIEIDGKLFGLGSNDAGASLVSLIAVFLILNETKNKPYNIVFAASAEEEVYGNHGIECVINDLGNIDLAIVGEPTQMEMAIAEKGLLVLDCETTGKTGHAALDEGVNSIYTAMQDIEWIKSFSFPKVSNILGEVKMTVTQINAGTQHNVIPDKCSFVIDIRTNELYSNEEVFEIIKKNLNSTIKVRSFDLRSSSIPMNHPVVQKGIKMGLNYYGSPTMSDQAKMPFPSIKIGPGDSRRSHTADEFIYTEEIFKGIDTYLELLKDLKI